MEQMKQREEYHYGTKERINMWLAGPAIATVIQLLFIPAYLSGWEPLSTFDMTICDVTFLLSILPSLPFLLAILLFSYCTGAILGEQAGNEVYYFMIIGSVILSFVYIFIYLQGKNNK